MEDLTLVNNLPQRVILLTTNYQTNQKAREMVKYEFSSIVAQEFLRCDRFSKKI